MGRRRSSARPLLRGAGSLSLAEYGMPNLPAFSWDSLPGVDEREKARAYVDALGLEPSPDRGMVLWRVECVLEDWRRASRGERTFDDEVLAGLEEVE